VNKDGHHAQGCVDHRVDHRAAQDPPLPGLLSVGPRKGVVPTGIRGARVVLQSPAARCMVGRKYGTPRDGGGWREVFGDELDQREWNIGDGGDPVGVVAVAQHPGGHRDLRAGLVIAG